MIGINSFLWGYGLSWLFSRLKRLVVVPPP
jgi:hypothetical protein